MNEVKLTKWGRTWTRNKARKYPENWATESEVFDFLYGFARMIKPENVLEIGTFEGDTAIAIAKALKANNMGRVITLDVKDFGQEENIKAEGLEQYVKCVKDNPAGFLEGLSNSYFDMAFIDDGHSYAECSRDLANCHRLIRPNGYILGHDVLMIEGVRQAYDAFISLHKDQYERLVVASYDGVFILKKIYA